MSAHQTSTFLVLLSAANWTLSFAELCGARPWDVVGWCVFSMVLLALGLAALCFGRRDERTPALRPAFALHCVLQTGLSASYWDRFGTDQRTEPQAWNPLAALFASSCQVVLVLGHQAALPAALAAR